MDMDEEKFNEDLDEEKEISHQELIIDDEIDDNINEVDFSFNEDSEYDDIIDEDVIDEHITNKKKTFNFLTKYEKNYIMGIRINQIINGSPLFVPYDKTKPFDIFKIVEQELYQKKIPFKIKRKLPNGNIELWNLKDLNIF